MEKDVGGRPTKYRKEYNEQVYKLALLGCIDSEMADILNVSIATFNNWKTEKKGFLESINKGKELADAEIAKSLYNRAKGCTVKEVKVVEYKNNGDEETAENNTVVTTTERELPPDTKAAQIWITNRQRKRWRQNPDNFKDDGTPKENNITLVIGDIENNLPSNEDDIEDFTKDED